MNEYNHHRIIERVALDRGLDASIKNIFIEASDFTDSINAKFKYFFYQNYYTIKAKSNTIRLDRVESNGYGINWKGSISPSSILDNPIIDSPSIKNINNSGEKLLNGTYSVGADWNHWTDEKEFFSAVNERCKSAHSDLFDIGNQSDNVAFLHAMGAEGETIEDSRSIFENHLKTCFAEYLFLKNEKDALFMLGIAFHGIMDSFTPSHMNFQKYTEQDMGLHAQGDVIPILGKFNKDGKLLDGNFSEIETVCFDPGQYTKEGIVTQEFIRKYKYYDGDDYLNPIEKEMFRIFLYISDIQTKDNVGWKSLESEEKVEAFLKTFSNNKKEINNILEIEPTYRYGPKSYAYSEATITVMREVYHLLSESKKTINTYDDYKQTKDIVGKAVNIWQDVYDGKRKIVYCINNIVSEKQECNMAELRSEHLKHDLYSKKKELESYKTEVELEKSKMMMYNPMY